MINATAPSDLCYKAAADATVAVSQTCRAIKREHERAMAGEVSVEYVLFVSLIAVALIGGLTLLGKALDGKIQKITDVISKSETIRPAA